MMDKTLGRPGILAKPKLETASGILGQLCELAPTIYLLNICERERDGQIEPNSNATRERERERPRERERLRRSDRTQVKRH
jgi:hypothetical protein